jgi:hypothetical protein
LAAAIRMEKAIFWGLAQAHCHIECPDRQIFLHSVARVFLTYIEAYPAPRM